MNYINLIYLKFLGNTNFRRRILKYLWNSIATWILNPLFWFLQGFEFLQLWDILKFPHLQIYLTWECQFSNRFIQIVIIFTLFDIPLIRIVFMTSPMETSRSNVSKSLSRYLKVLFEALIIRSLSNEGSSIVSREGFSIIRNWISWAVFLV